MFKYSDKSAQEIKHMFLQVMLKEVAFSSWGEETIACAERQLGVENGTFKLYFPKGVIDAIDYMCSYFDSLLVEKIKNSDISNYKTGKRVREAVVMWLGILVAYKETIEKTMAFLSLPENLNKGGSFLWRTASVIWYDAGYDDSVDFNYYSKRLLLMGVLSSVLLYFIKDNSDNFVSTREFLDNRLRDVTYMGKVAKFFKSWGK